MATLIKMTAKGGLEKVTVPDMYAENTLRLFPNLYRRPTEEELLGNTSATVLENDADNNIDSKAKESEIVQEAKINPGDYDLSEEALSTLSKDQLRELYKKITGENAAPAITEKGLIKKLIGFNK